MCVQVLLSPSLSALLYLITSTRMAHQCGASSVRLPSLAQSTLAKSGLLSPFCHPWLTLASSWQGVGCAVRREEPHPPSCQGSTGLPSVAHLLKPTHFPLLLLNLAFSSLGLEATSQPSGLGVWWGQPGLGLGRQEPHQHCGGGGPRSVTPGWRVK